MSALQIFEYGNHNVRTFDIDGDAWFVASDVAKVLGYRDAPNMTRRLDDEDKSTRSASTARGTKEMTVISFAGLMVAVSRSEVDGAKKFQRWVTHEVLPAVILGGGYSLQKVAPAPVMDLSSPESVRQILLAGVAAMERADGLQKQLEVVAPKVEAYEAFMGSDENFSIDQAAKFLLNDHRINIGEVRLFKWMRSNGWLNRDNTPTQRVAERGLLVSKISDREYWSESLQRWVPAKSQSRVTPEGLEKLRKILSGPVMGQVKPVKAIEPETRRKRRTVTPHIVDYDSIEAFL